MSLGAGDVAGFVFWTRNLKPLLADLPRVAAVAPFTVQFTLTGYPRALESALIEAPAALAQIQAIRRDWGPRAAVWRYDPILVSSLTPPGWHRANFASLAAALEGCVDEVVVSFLDLYRKTARNLAAAATRHGFAWRDPEPEEKRALLAELREIAARHGMRLTLCTEPALVGGGAEAARCIDAERLSDVAQRPIAAPAQGNRPGCLCARSRDIGAYDTCAHGCVYCYAVDNRAKAAKRIKAPAQMPRVWDSFAASWNHPPHPAPARLAHARQACATLSPTGARGFLIECRRLAPVWGRQVRGVSI